MTTFKTISEWISVDPKNDTNVKLLNLINKEQFFVIKRTIREKQRQIDKVVKYMNGMDALGLKVSDEQLEVVSALRNEIETMKTELPVAKKKTVPALKKGQKHFIGKSRGKKKEETTEVK